MTTENAAFDRLLNFSIRQRWFVMLAVAAMAVMGVFSYQRLPIDAVPDITNVQVQINAQAPGYSPLEAEQRVTFPVETVMAGLPGLVGTRSVSRYGLSQVTVIFDDGTDIYFARQLVNQKLQEAKGRLPAGIEPTLGPIATGLGEIFMYTVKADDARRRDGAAYSPTDLREVQDWIIRPQMRTVKGITDVNSVGGFVKQFHVTPDPHKLIAYGLAMDDIVAALEHNNANVGAGYIEKSGEQYLVRAPAQVTNLDEIREILIATHRGVPVRIKDVADVFIGKELRTGAATENGREVVLGTTFMLIGENSRTVARAAAAKLNDINSSLPAGVKAEAVYDRSSLVENTIRTVTTNLLEGAILVIAVLFAFFGNFRAALITTLVIPLAMLFAITGMESNKVSANLMSLGALDFGIIVDGAIVIVENCVRRLADEQLRVGRVLTQTERFAVVLAASRQARRALLYGQLIIIAVYLPIFTLTGVEGKMFHPMAFTVVTALAGAMILSVTFVPAAIAILVTGAARERNNRVMAWAHKLYAPALAAAMENKSLTVTAAVVAIILGGLLVTRMGSEFVPNLDEGDIALHALRIPGTSLTQAIGMQYALEKKIKEFPEVERIFAKIGTAEIANDPVPPSVADNFIMLKPRSKWPNPHRTKNDLIDSMEQALLKVPGNNYEFTQPIQMRFNELLSGVRSDVAVKIFGDDLAILADFGSRIEQLLATVAGAADVKAEQSSGLPVLTIKLDRAKTARYGLSTATVQDAISHAIGGREAGTIFEGDRRFSLIVRLPERVRTDIELLKRLPVRLPEPGQTGINSVGRPSYVPLGEIAEFEVAPGPNQISRENAKRRVVITANVRERDIGSFVRQAQALIAEKVKTPPGYWIAWGGQFEQLISASTRLQLVVPIALGLIILLLFIMFGNFSDGLLVFTGVPFALTGGVLALWLRGMPLSISAAIGFIALSGVAVLNGLVMISFMRGLRDEGNPLDEAIRLGALTRLRPVLITALVASLGFIPMAIATGVGAEVQRPLATVVIGGILSSTALTLFVLPVLYQIVSNWRDRRATME